MPFKKQIFTLLKGKLKVPNRIYQHLYFKGPFLVELDNMKAFKLIHIGAEVENEIFWKGIFGSWEKESLKIWNFLSQESKYIFDIGANTGVYSMLGKASNTDSNVYAFEPVNRVYSRLKDNIRLNNFDIGAYNIGISNENGEATIYDTGSDHIYSVTINRKLSPKSVKTIEVKVQINRFDSWFNDNKIQGLDLIKIDVETHEPEVLQGMIKLIDEYRPTLLIEVLSDEIALKIERLLKDFNYIYYNIDEKEGPNKIEKLIKSSSYNILICTKEIEKELKIAQLI